jgi:putative membrane protein
MSAARNEFVDQVKYSWPAGHRYRRTGSSNPLREELMKIELELLLIWILNALALLAVANYVPGIHVDGFGAALIAAFFLGLVNTLIRPLLLLLTLPVTLVTLGLFIFVINGTLFWLVGSVLRGFVVDNFWHGMLGAVLYSIFTWALSSAAAQLMRKSN